MSGLVKRGTKLLCLLENLSTIRVRQKASKRASRRESISSGRLKVLENEAIILVALSYGSRLCVATPAKQNSHRQQQPMPICLATLEELYIGLGLVAGE